MVLFAQATFNACAGFMPVCTVFLIICLSTLQLQSFTLGWFTPAIQSLQKRVASCLVIMCRLNCFDSHFLLLHNKNYTI